MIRVAATFAILIASSTASACLWNIDTTVFETLHIRDLDESLFGYFRRHSKAMYQWRIEDREARLRETPDDLDLIDDLAVSYEKVGQVQKAIEILEPVVEAHPRRYTSLANLGTMYVHAGDLERGAEFIARAIEVNPKAHFERERIQLLLVMYVLSKQTDGEPMLPLADDAENFADFVQRKAFDDVGLDVLNVEVVRQILNSLTRVSLSEAMYGLSGMVRFGNHDSPVLYEAIGDVTAANEQPLLAALAYRRAADVTDGETAAYYQQQSADCLSRANTNDREKFEADYEDHRTIANEYYREVETFEAEAIEAYQSEASTAPDPDAAYLAAYTDEPSFDDGVRHVIQNPKLGEERERIDRSAYRMRQILAVLAGLATLAVLFKAGIFVISSKDLKKNQGSQNPKSSS